MVKGWFCFSLLQGLGSYKGAADIFAIKNGHSLWIEVKTEKGYQTRWQKQFEKDRLLLEPAPDTAKLAALQTEISDLLAKMSQIDLSCQLKARTILTAEQRTRVPGNCRFGFNARGVGYGAGYGYGCGKGYGKGRGHGRGCRW